VAKRGRPKKLGTRARRFGKQVNPALERSECGPQAGGLAGAREGEGAPSVCASPVPVPRAAEAEGGWAHRDSCALVGSPTVFGSETCPSVW
jgi:hypothetical protein